MTKALSVSPLFFIPFFKILFPNPSSGYNEVLRIPAGAANIDITQSAHNNLGEDDNYLALRMANGEWLLNGQYQVSVFRQQIPVLDAVLEAQIFLFL
jgi:hypothetical protein